MSDKGPGPAQGGRCKPEFERCKPECLKEAKLDRGCDVGRVRRASATVCLPGVLCLPGVQAKIANLAIMPPGAAEDGRATANEIPPRVESAKPVAREAKLLYRC